MINIQAIIGGQINQAKKLNIFIKKNKKKNKNKNK